MIKIVLCFSIIINSLVFTQIIKVPDDKLTIQDAINSSNNGDTILVTEGLYAENINFKGKAITVASHYILDQDTSHISKTIIKGKNSSTVKFLSGESNSSLLMGFTIKNGSGISDPRDGFTGGYVGGGICIFKASPTVENCKITQNVGITYGAGIFCSQSSAVFKDLIISNNIAHYVGGGFYCYEASPKLINVELFNNHCKYNDEMRGEGGGIFSERSHLELINTKIYKNSATEGGGLVTWHNQSLKLSGVNVNNNYALMYGGVAIYDSDTKVTFDKINRSSIYLNEAVERADLSCFYDVEVYLDTFTVMKPTRYFTNVNLDKMYILAAKKELVKNDLYVSLDGNNNNSGLTVSEPLHSISFAAEIIDPDAENLLTIYIANGTYSRIDNFENFPIQLKSNTQIQGESHDGVIIKPYSNYSYFVFESVLFELFNVQRVSLNNFQIIEPSQAINSYHSELDIKNVSILKSKGGGIYCQNSILNLEDVQLNDNITHNYSYNNDMPYISNGNSGGAIKSVSSSINMKNVVIKNNKSDFGINSFGGGLYCLESEINLSNVKIISNQSGIGGGIYAEESNIIFDPENLCDIYSNKALQGSDIYFRTNDQKHLSIKLDTFSVDKLTNYYAFPSSFIQLNYNHCINDLVSSNLFVNPSGSNLNSGLTKEKPLKSIEKAMSIIYSDSLNPHSIFLSNGTYSKNETGDSLAIFLNDYLSIIGESQESTIIDGSGRGIIICSDDNKNNSLSNLTLINGHTALNCSNSSVNLDHISFLNNISSSTGGGICAYGSTLSLFRVLFAENESHGYFGWNVMPSGSAVHTENSSILFNHITISNNLATGGYDFGVIYGKHSDVKIVNSILWANNPDSILCDSSNFFICNSIISNGIKSVKYDDYGKLYWMNDNIDINPEFIITSLSNYHLNSSSPAIDEAYADTLIIYNEGNDSLRLPQSVFYGSAPDLGAFEYDPAVNVENNIQTSENFELSQNYPNPFNPTTTIKYSIPKDERRETKNVKLIVFDLLGREVAVLVNEKQRPGKYEVRFDVSNVNKRISSGLYFYRLTTEGFAESRKMILLK